MSNKNSDLFTITSEQREQIKRLSHELHSVLPPDLNNDLNLYRWIHGWAGNLNEASVRLKAYIENRKAAKLDQADLIDQFLTHPIIQNVGTYFSFSVGSDCINPYDNSIVVINRLDNIDFHGLTRVLSCGDFLNLYFLICERAFRQVLKRESQSARPSGLSVIYDLHNFPIWKYVNPNSEIHKIHKLCLHLLQDSYCDMLHKVYIMNAPTMAAIVIEMVKTFLNPMTREKLIVVPNTDTLLKYVHPSVVPAHFGGHFELSEEQLRRLEDADLKLNTNTCSLIPRDVTEKDYAIIPKLPVDTIVVHLKPKQKFEVPLVPKQAGNKLRWQFLVNSDVQFGVWKVDEGNEKSLVIPRLIMNTPKLPEQGRLDCDNSNCTYILEFTNCSTSWFSLKLEYAAYVD